MESCYGTCVKCGRPLTNVDSMVAGMGPTCRGKVGASDSGRLLGDAPVLVGVPGLREAGLVCRRLANGNAATNVPQLVVQHSPAGFEWGYSGSGPTDLALNILHILMPGGGSPSAEELCCDFRRDFIENIPKDGGYVPLEDMQAWVINRLTRG